MPVLLINDKSRIILNSCIAALNPIVEPAHRLIAPLHPWPEVGIVRKRMVPWPHDGFDRSLRLHQRVRNVVAIPVLQPPNQKTGNRDLAERLHALPPKWPIMLMLQIEQRPRWR